MCNIDCKVKKTMKKVCCRLIEGLFIDKGDKLHCKGIWFHCNQNSKNKDMIWFEKMFKIIGIVIVTIATTIAEIGLCSLSQGWFPSLRSLRSLRLLQRKLSNPSNYLFPYDHYSGYNRWDTCRIKSISSQWLLSWWSLRSLEWFAAQQ